MSVRVLQPKQFMEQYDPGDYGDEKGHLPSWDDIENHPGFHGKRPGRETHGGNFNELVTSLQAHGMREPVEVSDDFAQVKEGHHRVVAAARAGVPIKFRSE